jgi:hypothetical protein
MSETFISWEMVKRCMCKLREDQQQMADDIDALFNLGWPITDIHFAIRGDGKRGSGKVNDPFDGSDPFVLEDIINKVHYDNRTNVRFKFDKGEYKFFYPYNGAGGVKPLNTWNTMLDGWEFHGVGIGKTVFSCAVNHSDTSILPIGSSPSIFSQFNYVMHNRLVFKDFSAYSYTNLSNKGQNYNHSLIIVNADDLLISDVEVYGFGGNRFESFPIIAYANPATTAEVKCNHIFKRIYAHHNYHNGQGVCIVSCGWNPGLTPSDFTSDKEFHLVEDCRLEGAYLGTVNASNSYFKNCFVDCKAQDPEYGSATLGFTGFQTDTGLNKNIVIDGCTFINSRDNFRNSGCIHMGKPTPSSSAEIDGVVITNCHFHVKPSGFVYSAIHFRRGVKNWSICNNILRIDSSDTRPAAGLYLDPQSNDVGNGLILEDTGELYGNRTVNRGANDIPHRWEDDLKDIWTLKHASTGTWPSTANVARPLHVYREVSGSPSQWVERLSNGNISFTSRNSVANFQFGARDGSDNYTISVLCNGSFGWTFSIPLAISTIRSSTLSSNTVSGVAHQALYGSPSGAGRLGVACASGSNARVHLIYDVNGTPKLNWIEYDGTTMYVGTTTNGIGITDNGRVRILNASGYFDAATGAGYRVNNVKVVGDRNTGWTAPTGTGAKTGFTATAAGTASVAYDSTQIQTLMNKVAALEAHNKALYDALSGHGLIGT